MQLPPISPQAEAANVGAHVHDASLGARVGARDVGAADGAGVGSGVGSGLGTNSNETYEYDHLAVVTSGAAAATNHFATRRIF